MSRFGKYLNIIALVIFLACLPVSGVSAISGSEWQAGNFVDDATFFSNNSMTAAEIQSFLNHMVQNCDTWGAKTSEFGGGSRAQYGTNKGQPAPFVCLKDYQENPTTKANNLRTAGPVDGGMTAAQIIKYAADTYGISPKTLLVTLQKESSIITDDWPFASQYNAIMGYGCPDTGPNNSANCNASYYGFFNQITLAARQFRVYANNPSSYRYKMGQTNSILYNPSSACGSSVVYIENQASAGLYNYTPYQPNQAALNNLYGTGDSCSAYGNRNFWRLFYDWFGNPTGPGYQWKLSGLNIWSDATMQSPVRTNGSEVFLAPGQKAYVRVNARNNGQNTWIKSNTRLGTFAPKDYLSPFTDSSWIAPYRLVNMSDSSILPNQTATFQFSITAPAQPGFYTERYNLLTEGVSWFSDENLRLYITVLSPTSQAPSGVQTEFRPTPEPRNVPLPILSSDKNSGLDLSNGNLTVYRNLQAVWSSKTYNSGATRLVFQSDGNLVLYTDRGQAVWSSKTYNSGATRLVFQSDGNLVLYTDRGQAVWSSGTGIQDQTNLINRRLIKDGVMLPGQSLTTPDRRYTLILQNDGNLVLYSFGKPVWSSGTYKKASERLILQNDGNLVLYSESTQPLWSTQTAGVFGPELVLQQDGNLVLYSSSPNQASWSTNTFGK